MNQVPAAAVLKACPDGLETPLGNAPVDWWGGGGGEAPNHCLQFFCLSDSTPGEPGVDLPGYASLHPHEPWQRAPPQHSWLGETMNIWLKPDQSARFSQEFELGEVRDSQRTVDPEPGRWRRAPASLHKPQPRSNPGSRETGSVIGKPKKEKKERN